MAGPVLADAARQVAEATASLGQLIDRCEDRRVRRRLIALQGRLWREEAALLRAKERLGG